MRNEIGFLVDDLLGAAPSAAGCGGAAKDLYEPFRLAESHVGQFRTETSSSKAPCIAFGRAWSAQRSLVRDPTLLLMRCIMMIRPR
jgi:hypothetical protein